MDGESFDRLSVLVDRLRDRTTRRGALRLALGGSFAAAVSALGEGASAKKNHNKNKNKKRNGCRGYGAKCHSNHDCCSNNCFGNRCFAGNNGGGGGGNNCGGRRCPSGLNCCRNNGIDVCVPNNFPTCCGRNSFVGGYHCCGGSGGGACPAGWDCCGGFNQCCSQGWKCCGNGLCCPNGWRCHNNVCQGPRSAGISSEATQTMPAVAPETVDDKDWISVEPQ